jgi:hemerythrin
MYTLAWTPELSIGIPAMDNAHQVLLSKLSEIARAPDTGFSKLFFALADYLERDFKEEEKLMEEMSFYDMHPHREQHARVLYALHKVIPDVLQGKFDSARTTLELFPKWFVFHLSTMDLQFAMWFKLRNTDLTLEI